MSASTDPDDSNSKLPFVSVIVPCRNEAGYIQRCLRSILRSDYPADRMEIGVFDGMSTDGTRQQILEMAAEDSRITMRDNLEKVVAPAMNEGIRSARGEIVVRIDGHAEIAEDFLRNSVDVLKDHPDAWCAGGVIKTVGEGFWGRVIAAVMSSMFGVGNSWFRVGGYDGPVDTVAFGAYWRWVFTRIGLFDETLLRNQDDELNMRLILAGGTIWLSQSIRSVYHSRSGPVKLWRQYFQYGFWRIRTLMKHSRPATLRQLIPGLFAGSILLFALSSLWIPLAGAALAVILGLYCVVLIMGTVDVAWRQGIVAVGAPLILFLLHMGYGLGCIWGVIRFIILRGTGMRKIEDLRSSR